MDYIPLLTAGGAGSILTAITTEGLRWLKERQAARLAADEQREEERQAGEAAATAAAISSTTDLAEALAGAGLEDRTNLWEMIHTLTTRLDSAQEAAAHATAALRDLQLLLNGATEQIAQLRKENETLREQIAQLEAHFERWGYPSWRNGKSGGSSGNGAAA